MTKELVPKKIVAYLDDYIVRQTNAKKAIAIAIRNRYRRMQLPKELQEEITPKNIMMIGSTGVGKTEIARRLSKMMHIPFVKVEASKFTQVGFVGRDVESMVRDLLAVSISLVKGEFRKLHDEEIENYVLNEITKKIIPPLPKGASDNKKNDYERSFETMKAKVSDNTFDDKLIKINMPDKKRNGDNGAPLEMQEMQDSLSNLMSKISNKQNQKEVTVRNAKRILIDEAIENIISEDDIITEALIRAESGMIFIDEVDKIASNSSSKQSDPGKEGVQRDLLPIVEGSSVNTKYGILKTDHILFISAGAFSIAKPSDLIPELQGRFPIRVELEDLNEDDIFQILNSTKNSLIKQYEALFSVEGVGLIFTEESIREIAKYTYQANQKVENIGARRMHTVLEKILEDFSFEADEKSGESITITKEIVQDKLSFLIEDEDISRYIL